MFRHIDEYLNKQKTEIILRPYACNEERINSYGSKRKFKQTTPVKYSWNAKPNGIDKTKNDTYKQKTRNEAAPGGGWGSKRQDQKYIKNRVDKNHESKKTALATHFQIGTRMQVLHWERVYTQAQ